MARDTVALFLLFPPLALLAIVLFPLTLAIAFYLYYRGREQAREAAHERRSSTE